MTNDECAEAGQQPGEWEEFQDPVALQPFVIRHSSFLLLPHAHHP
jgi:hypothetical protein